MKVYASIVTYNNDIDEICNVLDCCQKSVIEKIYLIDNSPEDKIRHIIDQFGKAEYIWGHGNLGYGAAHNIGIKLSIDQKSSYHVVINPDIAFKTETINKLVEFCDTYRNTGLIMPKITYPNGEIQYLCKLLPTPMDLFGRRFLPFKKYVEKRNHKFEMRESGYDKILDVPYLSGCFMFFRTKALEHVGLFDDRFFMYCEDTDLSRRVHMKYKTIYYPGTTVIHAFNKESYRSKKLLKIHIQSAIKYFNKWGWFFDKERKKINQKTIKRTLT